MKIPGGILFLLGIATLIGSGSRFTASPGLGRGEASWQCGAAKITTLPVDLEIPGFRYLREDTYSCGSVTRKMRIYFHERTGVEFVLVPGGTFLMGSSWRDGDQDESPPHPVAVQPFLLCRTECTKKAWDALGGQDDRRFIGADLPVEGASWESVSDWCRKAGLRLPTEAEWEFACRADTRTSYSFGDSESELDIYAWHKGNSGGRPHEVKRKRPNAFGLHDMHGNVWELCSDRVHDSYRDAPRDGSSWDEGASPYRVKRGGSFLSRENSYCRSANRGMSAPLRNCGHVGFRPAHSIPREAYE